MNSPPRQGPERRHTICFSLVSLLLLGVLVWEWAARSRSWDEAPSNDRELLSIDEVVDSLPWWSLRGTESKRRKLQIFEAALAPPQANFTVLPGLPIAPPFLGYSHCFFVPTCSPVVTDYGTVRRCKQSRICQVCHGGQPCAWRTVRTGPSNIASQSLSPEIPTSA